MKWKSSVKFSPALTSASIRTLASSRLCTRALGTFKMSHSKHTKRGRSYSIDAWLGRGKRYIVSCRQCGVTGFKPSILESGFSDDSERRLIKNELVKIYEPLDLNDLGLCEQCSKLLKLED